MRADFGLSSRPGRPILSQPNSHGRPPVLLSSKRLGAAAPVDEFHGARSSAETSVKEATFLVDTERRAGRESETTEKTRGVDRCKLSVSENDKAPCKEDSEQHDDKSVASSSSRRQHDSELRYGIDKCCNGENTCYETPTFTK